MNRYSFVREELWSVIIYRIAFAIFLKACTFLAVTSRKMPLNILLGINSGNSRPRKADKEIRKMKN